MTKFTITLTTAVVSLGLATLAHAENPQTTGSHLPIDVAPPPASDSTGPLTAFTAVGSAQSQSGTVVLGKNFTIGPNQYKDFRLNYSLNAADNIAISIYAPNQSLDESFIIPYFAAPGAYFTAIDLIDCSQFNFSNQGGQVVPVYGSELVVRVFNLFPAARTYTQLMVHWTSK